MIFTPSGQQSPASKFPQPSTSRFHPAGTVAGLAVAAFLCGLHDRPFVDEYAYITQSYYADLFFEGRRNDPAWLADFAYDLQPLPKYFIGPVLHAGGLRMPDWRVAYQWYRDAHTRFGPPITLILARLPFLATGVLGCLALLGCGLKIGGRLVGTFAGVLLILNPLYRLHAHRAMSEVPYEAFAIAALGLGLVGWSRLWSGRGIIGGVALFAGAGICAGLSIVCKLNGLLAPMTLAAWCGLGVMMPRLTIGRKFGLVGAAAAGAVMTVATMLLLNPTLTAHPNLSTDNPELAARIDQGPWARFLGMVRYRLESTASQKTMSKFQEYVLRGPGDKAAVLAVQGFGRFGPFGPSESDSKVRYDLRQDWGALLWAPLVLFGMFRAFRSGSRQIREGLPPTALLLLIWGLVSWLVVAAYIPLAWDRYLLPIQAPNALLASIGIEALWDRWGRKAVAS